MTRLHQLTSALVVSALLAGCAAAPQRVVAASDEVIARHEGRIGVVMTNVPKVDTAFPGAYCLLCVGFAAMANASLTSHAHTLATDEVASYKANVIDALRKKGFDVIDIQETINVSKLPDARGKSPDHALKDFMTLKASYKVDKLLVLEVAELGFTRSYAAYVPNGNPQAIVAGKAYLVDLSTNGYDWYQPIRVTQAADGQWDEPPAFPGLTNAYFQAIERARDQYIGPFEN